MKTLRAKLFISMSAILLTSAFLNTITSEIWVKKELAKSGRKINHYVDFAQHQSQKFASFLLTFRILEKGADLERVSQIISSPTLPLFSSPANEAATLINYDPDIAFVEVEDEHASFMIAPKDAKLLSFSFAPALNNTLWVIVKNALFAAIPQGNFHLLFAKSDLDSLDFSSLPQEIQEKLIPLKNAPTPSTFHEVKVPSSSYNLQDSVSTLFQNLVVFQNEWLTKISLIQELMPWQEKTPSLLPVGILKIPQSDKEGLGGCLFACEAFPKDSVLTKITSSSNTEIPFLFLRHTGSKKDLNMVRILSDPFEKKRVALGFSLSNLLDEISRLIHKTIIVSSAEIVWGFNPIDGGFDPLKEEFPLQKNYDSHIFITWKNADYSITTLDLGLFKLFVLTPKAESLSTNTFLSELSQGLSLKISVSLIAASLLTLAIALILLKRISKKITGPITTLSKASEELSKGTYEGLILPEIGHRQDEVATLAHSFEGMVRALQDRDKIRGVLNKVVSKEISQEILNNTIELRGEEKNVTVLFSDIRNFTHLAENTPPRILIELLNSYLTRMCRIIDETRGVVDKFIGDGIMTLYGAPITYDFHAVKAIEAAILMIKDLKDWNSHIKDSREPRFEIGIGIHTGVVYTGNMGAENRLNYTAIGSNVNEASRLCSIAKGMQILISEETWQAPGVQERFRVQKLDPVHLKGLEHPVQIYEILIESS